MAIESNSGYDTFDFTAGMLDCREGRQADPKRSESYQAGYAAEYQLTEINSKEAERELYRKASQRTVNTQSA